MQEESPKKQDSEADEEMEISAFKRSDDELYGLDANGKFRIHNQDLDPAEMKKRYKDIIYVCL